MNIDTVTLSKAMVSGGAAPDVQLASNVERVKVASVPTRAAPSVDHVRAAAAQIDSYLKSIGRTLDIRVDGDSGRVVVTVRDSGTGDVIRQIPSEEALQLARSLRDGASGSPVVFDQTA